MTAEEDITCYKLVRQTKSGAFITPVQLAAVDATPGSVQTAQGNAYVGRHPYLKGYKVCAGYVHTFTEMNLNLSEIVPYYCSGIRVLQCHIPKGEMYFVGRMASTRYLAYASKSIVYDRDVTDEVLSKLNETKE